MPDPSSMTSNVEIARNPHAPEGLRRHGAVCCVAAPRRCIDIACVASPCIRPRQERRRRDRACDATPCSFTTGF